VYAARLAHHLGRIDAERVAEHVRVVAGEYGLDIDVPAGTSTPTASMTLMGRDKKALDGLTFVLDGEHGVEVVEHVPEAAVRATLDRFVA
jgi:5-deoxy-5-amino-3-dehydroquinate synthase